MTIIQSNLKRSALEVSSAAKMIAYFQERGYTAVGILKPRVVKGVKKTSFTPKLHVCPECLIVQGRKAGPNAKKALVRKAAKYMLLFCRGKEPRVAACHACGHWYIEGQEHHWSKSFVEFPDTTPQPPTPTPIPVPVPTTPAPSTNAVPMCKRCGQNPIPKGRTAFCLECYPPQKARTY